MAVLYKNRQVDSIYFPNLANRDCFLDDLRFSANVTLGFVIYVFMHFLDRNIVVGYAGCP